MKKIIFNCSFMLVLLLCSINANSQTNLYFSVQGDIDKFYPVVFADANWGSNVPTELKIGRSEIHLDGTWRGSLMAEFKFHTSRWGHRAALAEMHIKQTVNGEASQNVPFIAGYADATMANGTADFIIWLKGNSSYFVVSATNQAPVVYDGVQHPLPFQEVNGPARTYLTAVGESINSNGETTEGLIYLNGAGTNYINGSLGIGTHNTGDDKLAVNGKIKAREIKVEALNWPDYVFDDAYEKMSLPELNSFIKANSHLPDIPSAAEVKRNGIDLGEMNAKLLKKVEELTLHLIRLQEDVDSLTRQVKDKKND